LDCTQIFLKSILIEIKFIIKKIKNNNRYKNKKINFIIIYLIYIIQIIIFDIALIIVIFKYK